MAYILEDMALIARMCGFMCRFTSSMLWEETELLLTDMALYAEKLEIFHQIRGAKLQQESWVLNYFEFDHEARLQELELFYVSPAGERLQILTLDDLARAEASLANTPIPNEITVVIIIALLIIAFANCAAMARVYFQYHLSGEHVTAAIDNGVSTYTLAWSSGALQRVLAIKGMAQVYYATYSD